MSLTVLLIGGYGTFGQRIIRLLAGHADLTLICAGRRVEEAEMFCAGLDAAATVIPAHIDRDGDLAAALEKWRPELIVDASGPFQDYGSAPYRVVEAALAAGCDYIDLADAADFVAGIDRYDAQAKDRGIAVISGGSTFPALSAAVIRSMTEGWQEIDEIVHGLAPSPKAGLGRNVIEAIMSYAGKPVPVVKEGKLTTAPALIDSRYFTVAPPGVEPLPRLRFSLTELPDQTVFPPRIPMLQTLWTGVGTRPQIFLWGLNACAFSVRWGILRRLTPLSGISFWTMKRFAFGSHRGGLILRVSGTDGGGNAATREWHMIAEGDDGPYIPAIAVASLIERRIAGERPAIGARPATDDFSLADYERVFATKAIASGIREASPADAPLYHRVLGEAWHRLPPIIREMHTRPDGRVIKGRARVDRGRNPLARLVARIVGFPPAGAEVPVEVKFSEQEGGELWQRSFDGNRFSSFQKDGGEAFEHLLSERFGPLEFGLALVLKDDRLWLKTLGWRAFGIPMPRFLAPSGDAYEHVEDGRFCFHVEIKHWMTGLIVRYRGWLE